MKRIGIVGLILLYLGFRAVGAALAPARETDLEMFFLPSAKIALAGRPLHLYEVRLDVYPNANGPLGMVPLTLVAAIAERLGVLDERVLFRVMVALAFSLFPLLMAREAVRTIELCRGEALRGTHRLLVYGVFVLGPEVAMTRGHLEQPLMLWLLVASVRRLVEGRDARAGLLLGAALLTRTSALLYAPALGLSLVGGGHWRRALRLAVSTVLTVTLGLLPFALADGENLRYSLFTSHPLLPSLGGSLWEVVPGSALSAFGHLHDGTIALAASVLLSAGALALRPRRVGPPTFALLAACGLCLPLFMKSVWAYYYVDAYVLLAIAWLASRRRSEAPGVDLRWLATGAVPLAALLVGALTGYVVRTHHRSWTPRWSLTISLATLAVLALVVAWLRRENSPRDLEAAGP